MKKIVSAIAAICITSCGETTTTSGNTAPSVTLDKEFVVNFVDEKSALEPNNTITVTPVAEGVLVTGTDENAIAGGVTGGAYFVVDDDLEKRFSGQKILIEYVAKSTTEGGLRVAYSTNDVGNSGWQEFSLTNEMTSYTFEYDVPQMNNGRRDYVGFIPVNSGVILKELSLSVIK